MLNIIEGHINELFKKEQDLYDDRIKICDECQLESSTLVGKVCDARKCIKNGILYDKEHKPLKSTCGCGCRLSAKLRLKEEKCVLGKW